MDWRLSFKSRVSACGVHRPIGHEPESNHLLAALPVAEWKRWLPQLQRVKMPLGDVLYESGTQQTHIYFPTTPIVSLLYVMESGASAEIANELLRYTQALITQMAQTALCNRHHSLDQHLCRWLLAYMLGVRRVGVTRAASELQGAGHIEYHRGDLTVLDRAGLEAAACDCYAADRKSYGDVLELPASRRDRDTALVHGSRMFGCSMA